MTPLRVHGHLTSGNCMVSDRWQVKLGDFGCLSAKHAVGRKNAIDLLWTAPELLEEMHRTGMPSRCTPAGDIYRCVVLVSLYVIITLIVDYSFGIIIAEILTRRRAYANMNDSASCKSL